MGGREPIRISSEEAHQMVIEEGATPVDVIDSPSYDDYDYQVEGAVRIAPEDIGDEYQRIPMDHAAIAY